MLLRQPLKAMSLMEIVCLSFHLRKAKRPRSHFLCSSSNTTQQTWDFCLCKTIYKSNVVLLALLRDWRIEALLITSTVNCLTHTALSFVCWSAAWKKLWKRKTAAKFKSSSHRNNLPPDHIIIFSWLSPFLGVCVYEVACTILYTVDSHTLLKRTIETIIYIFMISLKWHYELQY